MLYGKYGVYLEFLQEQNWKKNVMDAEHCTVYIEVHRVETGVQVLGGHLPMLWSNCLLSISSQVGWQSRPRNPQLVGIPRFFMCSKVSLNQSTIFLSCLLTSLSGT